MSKNINEIESQIKIYLSQLHDITSHTDNSKLIYKIYQYIDENLDEINSMKNHNELKDFKYVIFKQTYITISESNLIKEPLLKSNLILLVENINGKMRDHFFKDLGIPIDKNGKLI